MLCQRMSYKPTLPRSCTIVSGNTTKTSSSGSSEDQLLMDSVPPIINTYSSTSIPGNVAFSQAYLQEVTSLLDYCLKMMYA